MDNKPNKNINKKNLYLIFLLIIKKNEIKK